jgi:hypothetical protein
MKREREMLTNERPRCKGTCGDVECEHQEDKWRVAAGFPIRPVQLPLFILESEETPYTPIVMIESPYKGDNYKDLDRNMEYLRAALHDCLLRGEAPFASHAIYTQVLDDKDPAERDCGIKAGFAFREASAYTVVYEDLGVTPGMKLGIEDSIKKHIPVKYRSLPGWRKEDSPTTK